MIGLGKKQRLSIIKRVEFGVYLAEHMPKASEKEKDIEKVLLPKKQVPEEFDVGDSLEVFIYKDSKDRLIATTNEPKLMLSQIAMLEVSQVNQIGAFLDWGLEKELFLPFKEQTRPIKAKEKILVALYIDKSERLAATMKLYPYLQIAGDYEKDDMVTGTVYEIEERFGAYVAVDNHAQGMLSTNEPWGDLRVGQVIKARVVKVKEDGKLDLSLREKAYLQMDVDAEKIMALLKEHEGVIALGDKSDPDEIKQVFGMSKNEFKRAAGRLYKQKMINISAKEIRMN